MACNSERSLSITDESPKLEHNLSMRPAHRRAFPTNRRRPILASRTIRGGVTMDPRRSRMRRKWLVIEAAPDSSMVVIRFKPGGAYPCLGADVEGITDTVAQLEDVIGYVSTLLRDRILEARTVDERLAVVDDEEATVWALEREWKTRTLSSPPPSAWQASSAPGGGVLS